MWAEAEDAGAEEQAMDAEKARLHEEVFLQLMAEVQHAAPGARLSARLRATFERMSPAERAAVCARTVGGCAPLFVAARRGNAEVVEYLAHVGGAPLEQRGLYSAGEGAPHAPPHRVTPLWAAAVAGRLDALRALADAGAELDARSDSGSTPLRSACFMTNLDVVRFLCERGADVRARNHNGGTCLINAVQSPHLCRYLLERGAPPDARDAHGKTALHYAVREHRADTARMLLVAGADPHVRSLLGDDALRTAAARGAAPLVELLLARGEYAADERADAYELLGATQLDEFEDETLALESWRLATEIRRAAGPSAAKRAAEAHRALRGASEWRTERELDELAGEWDALRVQALLVCVRVLGEHHKDTVFRLMFRGAAYADSLRYEPCVELWSWALRVRIARDTLLHADTSHTACALTRLVAGAGAAVGAGGEPLHHHHAMHVLHLIVSAVPESQRLMSVRPWCAAQAEAWERTLRSAVHLVAAAHALASSGGERRAVLACVRRLVSAAPRTLVARDTLLHLACERPALRSAYFAESAQAPLGPDAAQLLLACGADARARNALGRTALHAAVAPQRFCPALLEALLASGAHLCTPDAGGVSPLSLVSQVRGARVRPLQHVSLCCLAARALLAAGLGAHAAALLPRALAQFLDLHRCTPDEPAPL